MKSKSEVLLQAHDNLLKEIVSPQYLIKINKKNIKIINPLLGQAKELEDFLIQMINEFSKNREPLNVGDGYLKSIHGNAYMCLISKDEKELDKEKIEKIVVSVIENYKYNQMSTVFSHAYIEASLSYKDSTSNNIKI